MKKEILITGIVLGALWGCNQNTDPTSKQATNETKDSLTAVIDSIRLANLHKNFSGRHAHPGSNKNLAVHAHQNIPKKVKFTKTRAKQMERTKRIEKMKKESRRKILEEKGILKSND